MESKTFYIAGVQHHELNKVLGLIEEGCTLDLVSEPTNKFDSNAIKIMCGQVMTGYVPRKFSADVTAWLTLGPVKCVITKLNKAAKPWEMCQVEVSPVDDGFEE